MLAGRVSASRMPAMVRALRLGLDQIDDQVVGQLGLEEERAHRSVLLAGPGGQIEPIAQLLGGPLGALDDDAHG